MTSECTDIDCSQTARTRHGRSSLRANCEYSRYHFCSEPKAAGRSIYQSLDCPSRASATLDYLKSVPSLTTRAMQSAQMLHFVPSVLPLGTGRRPNTTTSQL